MTDSYIRPETLAAALAARDGGARPAAGCTDLFPATERKTLPGAVLDLTGIPALNGIAQDSEGLRIGATTSWTTIARTDLPPACAGLQQAALQVGARQIQNRGTIGGNLCNASPAADGVPPLLTLDAQVELASRRGTRLLPLADFLTGPRKTALAQDEILTAVVIPAPALDGRGEFLKLGARSHLVISIAMAAARITLDDTGRISGAALAVGACSPVAMRLGAVETALVGSAPDPTLIDPEQVAAALSPIDDVRADAGYRAQAATQILRRLMTLAAKPGTKAA